MEKIIQHMIGDAINMLIAYFELELLGSISTVEGKGRGLLRSITGFAKERK